MKMSKQEKEKMREKIKSCVTPKNENPPRIGTGRKNERYERAANRRAADIYVQNF